VLRAEEQPGLSEANLVGTLSHYNHDVANGRDEM
jgi:hypothetical protein